MGVTFCEVKLVPWLPGEGLLVTLQRDTLSRVMSRAAVLTRSMTYLTRGDKLRRELKKKRSMTSHA